MNIRVVQGLVGLVVCLAVLVSVRVIQSSPEVPIDPTAVNDVRTLMDAEERFHVRFDRYATREELVDEGLVEASWRTEPTRDGYHFEIRMLNNRKAFIVAAAPLDRSTWFTAHPTARFFYGDQSGAIHTAVARPAGPNDPTL